MKNMFEPGQQIETTIVAISGDTVFLDLNAKSEGILDRAELTDGNGKCTVQEGDKIKAYFTGTENGEMKFTTKISGGKADKQMLENAFKNGIPVEGHVEKEIKGGYEVMIGTSRAFCPYSQMGYRQKEESSAFVGRHLTFRIQEYKNDGRNIIVSNRVIMEDEHAKSMAALQSKLKDGMIIDATVKSLQSYGAFVDIDGFQALLPISEIALDRVTDISTLLKADQKIRAKIIKTDWQNERVSVSMKALLADPWDSAVEKYPVGSKHDGFISRIAQYGVFVELEPGLDGLVHVSEMEGIDRNSNLTKLFKKGDKMTVSIKDVNTSEKRLSLTPTTSVEQDKTTARYMAGQNTDDEGYNPFAALLKK
ncbi:MAG: S1 RNA-binding domain-containing protein [Treponema sp.]|nr:S1 RNA-binding domain-containing protein [Treponema sp.]